MGPQNSGKTGILRDALRTVGVRHCYLLVQQCINFRTTALIIKEQLEEVLSAPKLRRMAWGAFTTIKQDENESQDNSQFSTKHQAMREDIIEFCSAVPRLVPIDGPPIYIIFDNAQWLCSRLFSEPTIKAIHAIMRLPETCRVHIILLGRYIFNTSLEVFGIEDFHINSQMLNFPCYSFWDLYEVILRKCPVDEPDTLLWKRFLKFFGPSLTRYLV